MRQPCKTRVIIFRVTEEQWAELRDAARQRQQTLSQWMRAAAAERAAAAAGGPSKGQDTATAPS